MKNTPPVANPGVRDLFQVLDDCHRAILLNLDKLTSVVAESQLKPLTDQTRGRMQEVVEFFCGPAREHNYDEERHVFPTLVECDDVEVKQAAETLREDHAWIEFSWLDVQAQLTAAIAGAGSYDASTLSAAAQAFAVHMRKHIALEELQLYPRLRERLSVRAVRVISREIAARRTGTGRRGQ